MAKHGLSWLFLISIFMVLMPGLLVAQKAKRKRNFVGRQVTELPDFIRKHYDTTGVIKPVGRYPDFSIVGYTENGSESGRAPDYKVFKVQDYGAMPDDGKDDVDAIQRAVDAAVKNGSGIVLFPRGRFDFDVERVQTFVTVKGSNIIIRGYGPGPGETELVDHKISTWPDKSKKWLSGTYPSFFKVGDGIKADLEELLATVKPFRQHETSVQVESAAKLKVGQVVCLAIKAKEKSDSSVLWAATYPSRVIGRNLARLEGDEAFKIRQLYRIKRIEGNVVEFDAPLLVSSQANWQAELYDAHITASNIIIEGFRLTAPFTEEFVHHKNPEHDNGADGIKITTAVNCLVRGVEFRNVTTAVGISNSLYCSVERCRIVGNRGHNGYLLVGNTTRCLVSRCQGGNQMHTFGLSGYASGNVMTQCIMSDPGGIDCHGGLGMFNLIDAMDGGVYASGGAAGNTPPGIGTGLVFYNWAMGALHPYNFQIAGPTISTIATPGCALVGVYNKNRWPVMVDKSYQTATDQSDALWIESLDRPFEPASLLEFMINLNK